MHFVVVSPLDYGLLPVQALIEHGHYLGKVALFSFARRNRKAILHKPGCSCGISKVAQPSLHSGPWNLRSLSDMCSRSSDVIHFSACTPFEHPPEEEVFTVGFYFKKCLQAAAERHLLLDLCCLLSENKTAHRSTLSSACWRGKNTLKTNDWSIELHFQ